MRYLFEIIIKIFKRILSLWKQLLWKISYGRGFKCGKLTFFYSRCRILIEHTGDLCIGNNCFFNNDCSINCLHKIEIGNNCIFGENVKIYDHNHKFRLNEDLYRKQPYTLGKIKIGNNCWIGSNVVILAGVSIGNNVVIGAGAVITTSISDNTLVIDKSNIVKYVIV